MPRAGLTSEKVIAAAQALSDEVGLDGLTLAALAGRLGVRQPSLYKHIDGSDALRRALAVRARRDLAAVLARDCVGRSGDDAIVALAHAYRGWAHTHPGLYQSIVAAPAPGDVEVEAASLAVVPVLLDILAGYGLSGEDAIHVTWAVRAALHGFVSIEAAGGYGMPIDIDASYSCLVATITRAVARSV